MIKSSNGEISIDISSEEELVQDVAGMLIEIKRQLRFKLGRAEGDDLYNRIIEAASMLN